MVTSATKDLNQGLQSAAKTVGRGSQPTAVEASFNGLSIQRKLSIGAVNDPLEFEADAMADKVMRMPESSFIQRKCSHCEEEENIQRKPLVSFIQKKATQQGGSFASDAITSKIRSSQGKGEALNSSAMSFMESRFGSDFSGVSIHTDSDAVQLSTELNAQAFTVGNDIYFNDGKYAPESSQGKHLLAHELTHTVQQGHETINRQVQDEECNYERGEVSQSHSSNGHLDDDVVELNDGRLLISDFGVDWRHVNPHIAAHPVFRRWDSLFASDDTYQIHIVGFSDCVGSESNNTRLRHARAQNVENILSPQARQRVMFRGMAGINEYVYPNTSAKNRARNRGVLIRFSREFNFDPDVINVTPRFCGPGITSWLINQMNTNRNHPAIRKAREVRWPRYIPFFNLGWTYGFLSDFRELVRAGGPWDFKSQQGRRGTGVWRTTPGRSCPSLPCDTTITMCGQCYNYDVPGNIHYGYVGVAAGLRPWFLHNRADAAQAGGVDDPKDTVAIDIGIRMYTQGTTLCEELSAHRNRLNLNRTEDCNICG